MKNPADTDQALGFLEQGLREFAVGQYFEAHDTWEEFWQRLRGPDRLYLQGLIHLAVGAYHHGNSNAKGATSQWRKAADKLGRYPAGHWGLELDAWLTWIEAYLNGAPDTSPPAGIAFDRSRFPDRIILADE